MDRLIAILGLFIALSVIAITFPNGNVAVLVTAILSLITIVLIRLNSDDSKFLIRIFLIALFLRIIFGTFIHVLDLRSFFGGDANTYDGFGQRLVDIWLNNVSPDDYYSKQATSIGTPGWGLNYLVGALYTITGRDILAAQFMCATIGAATAPLVYVCSNKIFHNHRVSRIASVMVAVFPAFIIWSGQLLKDGLIIFLLVLAMTMVLELQERFNYVAVALLIFSLFGILSLRFYIFYMVAISVAGSFVLGQTNSVKSITRGFILLILLGLALTYLGVLRTATENFDKWGSLEKIQLSRMDLARSAESGFGESADVSTAEGALTTIPIGFTYLMFAPFPWQFGSLRQSIAVPEVIIWWSMIPLMIAGLVYTIRHRLQKAIAVLIFTLMLTIAYSIFQGNVGTAYRQRTQIQVFLFMFIAVGWELRREKRENEKILDSMRKRKLEEAIYQARRNQ